MLEHQKIVLKGVRDNKELFKKELEKSLKWIGPNEQRQLKEWLTENFAHLHAEIIREVFKDKYNMAS